MTFDLSGGFGECVDRSLFIFPLRVHSYIVLLSLLEVLRVSTRCDQPDVGLIISGAGVVSDFVPQSRVKRFREDSESEASLLLAAMKKQVGVKYHLKRSHHCLQWVINYLNK